MPHVGRHRFQLLRFEEFEEVVAEREVRREHAFEELHRRFEVDGLAVRLLFDEVEQPTVEVAEALLVLQHLTNGVHLRFDLLDRVTPGRGVSIDEFGAFDFAEHFALQTVCSRQRHSAFLLRVNTRVAEELAQRFALHRVFVLRIGVFVEDFRQLRFVATFAAAKATGATAVLVVVVQRLFDVVIVLLQQIACLALRGTADCPEVFDGFFLCRGAHRV
eukprot:EW706562.1.p2 GENE.EW706562.1~~EW706562.1.p2  ORF type:complete len:227 (-),score=88.45 EW706562.1:24-677(-)